MAQQEGMHMVLERTAEEQISPQESREKKAAPEQELTTTVSDKKKCFACKETSHTLEQCRIKEKLVTVAQLFGHSTGSPFYMIQPSEEAVEKQKFHHHCLQITSNVSNLDLGKVKVELNKLWKLTNDCEIRREDRQNFLASFSSEDDLISCLKPPEMETFTDDKEVKFTIARWKEGYEENLDLIREWFLVYGVPRIYRNWKKLYQVASAVGVLIEVDEESLEGGDKEPIRLRMALRNLVGAPFSDHFVFGWSSRLVTFTIADKVQRIERQRKELEDWNGEDHLDGFNKKNEDKRNKGIEIPPETLNKGMNSELSSCTTGIVASTGNHILDFKGCSDKEHKKEMKTTETAILLEEPKFIEELRVDGEIKENNISAPAVTTTNSKKTTEDTPKAEGVQSICGSSIGTIRGLFRDIAHEGIQKPPIKNVYGRRKNQVQKGSMEQQIASKKPNEGMNPESSSRATRIAASTGCNMLDSKSCLEKEHAKVLKMAETALVGEGPKSIEEFGEDGENKDNNVGAPAATAINSKKQTTEDSVKAEGVQSFSGSSTCMVRGTQKKGADMTGMGQEGAEIDARQLVSKMNAQLTQNSKELSTYNEIYESFSKMGLQENLLRGIYAYGLEKPSIVHQRGIALLCKGVDVIQQSLSGTTVTLSCGVLQRLDYGSTECQALVLVPTRDLAQETEKVVGALGHFLGVKAHACFGGHSVYEDQQILSSRVQVVVGTPGRVLDMLRRQALCPDHIRMFVLDEADEILTGGFKDQIYDIIQLLPTNIQVGVFSATMSHEALEICRKFAKKPLMIIVPRDEELQGISIKQFYVKVEREELKLDKLCDLFDTMAVTQSIIFVNSRRKVKSLTEKMRGKEYTVSASHGGMDQHARDSAVQEFLSGSSRVLIATDLRGTDVLHAPVVVNYDLPTQPVHYLRHMQRSGQPGRKGVAISFVTRADERVLSDIQRFCNSHIGKLPSNVADLL